MLRFAVRADHLPSGPADGVELPPLPEIEQHRSVTYVRKTGRVKGPTKNHLVAVDREPNH